MFWLHIRHKRPVIGVPDYSGLERQSGNPSQWHTDWFDHK